MLSYKHLIHFRCLGGVKNSPLYGVKKSPPRRLLIKITRRKRNIKEKANLLTESFFMVFSGKSGIQSTRHSMIDIF